MFSFIVPVYNASLYIQDCLNSILKQKCNNYELIIVDDGSTDNSVELIDNIIKNKENCSLILNEHAGVCKARNSGITYANGDYLCFVDADDIIFEDYLTSLEQAIIQYNPDVLYFYAKYGINSRQRMIYEDSLYELDRNDLHLLAIATLYHRTEMKYNEKFFEINSFSSWGQVYKRKIYVENKIFYTEGITLSEDGLANLELLYYTNKGIVICKQLYNYRMDNISATRSYKPDLIDVFDHRDRKVKRIIQNLYSNDENEFMISYYCSLIYQIRIISENYIFHYKNQESFTNKKKEFLNLINKPDYAHAIKICNNQYLLENDRIYLDIIKKNSPEKISKYLKKKQNQLRIRFKLKNFLKKIKPNI